MYIFTYCFDNFMQYLGVSSDMLNAVNKYVTKSGGIREKERGS